MIIILVCIAAALLLGLARSQIGGREFPHDHHLEAPHYLDRDEHGS